MVANLFFLYSTLNIKTDIELQLTFKTDCRYNIKIEQQFNFRDDFKSVDTENR